MRRMTMTEKGDHLEVLFENTCTFNVGTGKWYYHYHHIDLDGDKHGVCQKKFANLRGYSKYVFTKFAKVFKKRNMVPYADTDTSSELFCQLKDVQYQTVDLPSYHTLKCMKFTLTIELGELLLGPNLSVQPWHLWRMYSLHVYRG